MDTPELEAKYMTAGREYLQAIKSLGLDPDGLFWAYDAITNEYVLMLITPMFDFKGPFELSSLLFEAYNKSATPKEIDPFTIRLHSPKQSAINQLLAYASGSTIRKVNRATKMPEGEPMRIEAGSVDGVQVHSKWLIQARSPRRRSSVELSRQWERFERNVDSLAA